MTRRRWSAPARSGSTAYELATAALPLWGLAEAADLDLAAFAEPLRRSDGLRAMLEAMGLDDRPGERRLADEHLPTLRYVLREAVAMQADLTEEQRGYVLAGGAPDSRVQLASMEGELVALRQYSAELEGGTAALDRLGA